MSATLLDTTLGPAVIGHLDAQLISARRLLDLVLRQGQAIRAQDVETVLNRVGEIQGEMERRGRLEADRARLLEQAGAALGLPGHAVTLEALTSLMSPADGTATTTQPDASARTTVPWPPWHTTTSHRGIVRE